MEQRNNLDTIAIFHFISGGLKIFASLFVLIYVVMGAGMIVSGGHSGGAEMQITGGVILIFGLFGFLLVVAMGIMSILCGKYLKERRNRIFCMVISGIACMNAPLGTVLGVFTILEIEKPEVKPLFEANKARKEEARRMAGN